MHHANEEKKLKAEAPPTSYPVEVQSSPDKSKTKMQLLLRRLLFTILVLACIGMALASSTPKIPRRPSIADQKKFQETLDSVETACLHDLLYEHVDKYKEGVYQDDKSAVAAVHGENAEAASSLVALARRQDSSSSSSNVTTTTATTTAIATTTVVSQITTSFVTTISSTQGPSSSTSTTTSTSSPITSTSQGPTSVLSTSNSSSTSGPESTTQALSASSSETSTPVSLTSFIVYTSTQENGARTTVTTTTVVPAQQPDLSSAGGSSTKTSVTGSLQTNGARPKFMEVNIVVGAMGVALLGAL